MFPRTLFLGSSLNRGNPPPWPKPIPRGHKEKAKKSSSKIDRIDRKQPNPRKRPAKAGIYTRSITRGIFTVAVGDELCAVDNRGLASGNRIKYRPHKIPQISA